MGSEFGGVWDGALSVNRIQNSVARGSVFLLCYSESVARGAEPCPFGFRIWGVGGGALSIWFQNSVERVGRSPLSVWFQNSVACGAEPCLNGFRIRWRVGGSVAWGAEPNSACPFGFRIRGVWRCGAEPCLSECTLDQIWAGCTVCPGGTGRNSRVWSRVCIRCSI
jgi:hypothetical protein